MKFLKRYRRTRKTEKGNIFFMLFAAVGVVGALGVGSTTILKGPVSSMVKTNQVTMIENRAELDLKLMINNIITTTPDCDSDDTIEAMEWRDAVGGEPPVITGGGYLPAAIAGATTDPWGRELGYCVWDNGSAIDDVGCGGATQDRLTGSILTDEPFVAVVSAGPDQKFQTSCVDFVDTTPADGDPDTPLIARVANSDDIVLTYTYDELKAVMGDNWLYTSDSVGEDTVKTNQGVEITNDVTISTGVLDMNLLGGTLSLSEVPGSCTVARDGQMFRDASVTPPAIMLCDSGTFVSIGGGGASSDDCAGKTTGICIGFDPEAANCEVNNGDPFVEAGAIATPNLAFGVWGDGTYIYVGVRDDGVRAYTFDGSTFTEVGAFNTPGHSHSVWGDGTYIYVGDTFSGVRAYTFDGSTFTEEGFFNTPDSAFDVWGDGTYIYVADSASGVRAYTFDGSTFTEVGAFDTPDNATGVWGDGTYIYVGDANSGVRAYSFDGSIFTELGVFYSPGQSGAVWGDGTYIYVTINSEGIAAYTFDGSTFTEVDIFETGGNANDIWGDGTYLYVSTQAGGLRAYSGFECTSISAKPEIDTKTDRNTKIYGWGGNGNAQFVDPAYGTTDQPSAVEITGLNDIRRISLGISGHACGIDSNDQAWCWGEASNFKQGHNNFGSNQPPTKVIGENSNFKSISAALRHTCALKYDGTAWCWGYNSDGQLGDGTIGGSRATPEQVVDITDFIDIRTGGDNTCGIRKNKELWCWGEDDNGELGNGTLLTADLPRPSKVQNLSGVVQIGFAGYDSICALTESGNVWCWGQNDRGQLGIGSVTADQPLPVKTKVLSDVIQIAQYREGASACALKQDGTAWCWGHGFEAQLGNGSTSRQETPTQVATITDFVKISTLGQGGCGLRANGEIWCWGADGSGQLGNGAVTTGSQYTPVLSDPTLKFYDFVSQSNEVIAYTKDYTDGDESLPVAPVMIQQSHDAGEAVGSHGLAVTYNGPSGDRVGIALTVDADADSGDPTSVNINARKGTSEHELRFTTNSTDILRLKKDSFTIGNENGVIGTRVGQLQIGVHDGGWSLDLSYIDGLLISKKGVATLNPSYFGVNSETGETNILSGRELLIQHTDDTGVTIAPVASFLNNTGSTFFGAVNIRGGDFTITAYTDTATEHASYKFFRYRGDATTPTQAIGSDHLGRVRFLGYAGGNYTGPADIQSRLIGNFGVGDLRTNLIMNTGSISFGGASVNDFAVNYDGIVLFNRAVSPKSLLTIGGRGAADEGVKFSNDTTCASAAYDEGTIRWTGTTYEYCDGTQWLPMIPTAVGSTCTDDETFYDIGLGLEHSCAVYSNGQVVCWGRSHLGQLGNGTLNLEEASLIPISRSVIDDAIKVASGWGHSCALTKKGEIYCWGGNSVNGELGNGSADSMDFPIKIASPEKFIDVGINHQHGCGITEDNALKCWGNGGSGQLGDGGSTDATIPQDVYGIDNAVKVSVGYNNTCVVLADKTAKCWGDNAYGELGRGTFTAFEFLPGAVTGLTDVIDIDINGRFSGSPVYTACAVKTDGTVWCWGSNGQGQLGNGSTGAAQANPLQVTGITNAIDVEVGREHVCALRADGTVSCWGDDLHGKLGSGASTLDSSTPVTVTGIATAVKIDVGDRHSCALLFDGAMQCWGNNAYHRLGDGTNTNRPEPVDVINSLSCDSDKYVFLTSISYPADLGGLEGADAVCQSHADQVRLPGTYKAWLSDSTNSPSTRFNRLDSTYDYKLVNGTVVADGWDDLTDGTIDTPIIVTEENVTLANDVVPTNTATDGTAFNATENCANWTTRSGALNYNRGRFSVSDSRWTFEGSTSSCNSTHKLYCFQQ